MENGNLFKFAQDCLVSVEVSPNLMDKGAQMSAGANGECIILLRVVYLANFGSKKWAFPQDECRPICLSCWKSVKFVKHFEISGKQMHLGYCPGSHTYSVKFSAIYLFSSNLYEFLKKGHFLLAGKRS